MNKNTAAKVTEIVAEMHRVQGVIDSLRAHRPLARNAVTKREHQIAINEWSKDLDALVEQLLAATTELAK